tara:strand:+ start:64 stop:1932 length:1869 start_codon:yes stop_codon:yes gene_type:complete
MRCLKNILLIFFLFLTIIFSAFIWGKLDLPFNNEDQIIGFYSVKNVSHLNDILGYVLFITIPTIFFIMWLYFVEKKKFNFFLENIRFKNDETYLIKIENIFLFLIIGSLFFEFLSVDFPDHKLDYFHEGQRLSAAYNNKINNDLWSGSYITVGLFFEILGPKLIWKIFDYESIGLLRFLDFFLIFLTKVCLIVVSYQIAKHSKLRYFTKNLFFFILCIFSTELINYTQSINLIEYRDLPILLTLIFFFCLINKWNKNNIYLILIGTLCSFSYLWSVDRALVQNFLSLFIIIYLLINIKFKETTIILLSFCFSFMFIFLVLGDEFGFFISNTISTFKEATLLNGIIHPIPFGGGSFRLDFLNIDTTQLNNTRTTKTIIAILFSIILSIRVLLFSNKINYNSKIFLLTISIVSFLSYIYALGRTDYSHIKQVFGYPLFFYIILVFHLITNQFKIDQFKYFNSIYTWQKYSIFLLIIIFFTLNINFSNLYSFKKRFNDYVALNDESFVDDIDKEFIDFSIKELSSETCVSLFSNDVALLYLIKKPSCTKYYYTYTIGSLSNQKKMINELTKTNYILVGGKIDKSIELHKWSITLNQKYPLITEYLNKNFQLYKTIGNRKILARTN